MSIRMIPTMHPTLRDLLQFSSKRGWMSFEELNTALPDEYIRPDKMNELLIATGYLGITFVNHLDRKLSKGPHFYAPLQTNLRFKRDNPRRTYNLATEEEIRAQELAEAA
ncbi:MAG: RNA polymerase sigma factor region1.1 domain-containing protein, partial [Phycisphaerales bacterium]|nr:RNA polymerase sigma factor region1.1 domain-containing protein [Phycisphaerales bacterium]